MPPPIFVSRPPLLIAIFFCWHKGCLSTLKHPAESTSEPQAHEFAVRCHWAKGHGIDKDRHYTVFYCPQHADDAAKPHHWDF